MKTTLLLIIIFTAVIVNCNDDTIHKMHNRKNNQNLKDDRFSEHGFQIIPHQYKDGHVYLSHVPAYMSPHDFQFLFEAKLQNAKTILNLNHNYSTISKYMSLNSLMNKTLSTFQTDLYDGNFINDNLLEENVTITVVNIVYIKQLTSNDTVADNPSYIAFGGQFKHCGSGSYNLLHVIGGPSNFDHIVQADIILDGNYDDGSILTFEDVENNESNRISNSNLYEADLVTPAGDKKYVSVQNILLYSCRSGPSFDPDCVDVPSNLLFLN